MGDSGSGSGGGAPTSAATLEAKINQAFADLQTQIADEINKVKQAQKEKRAAMEEKLKAIIDELEKAVNKPVTVEMDPELEAKLKTLGNEQVKYDREIASLETTIKGLPAFGSDALKALYQRKIETLTGLFNEYLVLIEKTKDQHKFTHEESKADELVTTNEAITEIEGAIETSKSYLEQWDEIIAAHKDGGDGTGSGDLKAELKEQVQKLSAQMTSVNTIHEKYSIPDVKASEQPALGHARPRPIHAPSSPFVPSGRRRTQPSNFFKL